MVTRSGASEDGARVFYSVGADVHFLDPDHDVDGVEASVLATQNRAGHWNCEFQGPDSLTEPQREACLAAVMEQIVLEEAEARAETERRIEALRLAAETPAAPARASRSRRTADAEEAGGESAT